MPIQKFIAVTAPNQWCCAGCGCLEPPTHYGKYSAVVKKSGPAIRLGPIIGPTADPHSSIYSVNTKNGMIEERYECAECGIPYVGVPLNGSVTMAVHEALGAETMEIDVPNNTVINFFLPGQDGALYGQGMYFQEGMYRSEIQTSMLNKLPMQPVRNKEGLITWKNNANVGGTAVVLADMLPAEVMAAMHSVFLDVAGDAPDAESLAYNLRTDLVVWALEDYMSSAYYYRKACINSLVMFFTNENWWSRADVHPLNLLSGYVDANSLFDQFYGTQSPVKEHPGFYEIKKQYKGDIK